MTRDAMLRRLEAHDRPWDMVIVGGGATGAGIAVDAASRGYDVLLVEQCDFGKGTSSRSTKLVHGGVRYLEQGNISLVMEALKERGMLRQNAPHLVHDLAFVVPNYDWWEAPFYGLGLKVYNLLAGQVRIRHVARCSRAKRRWSGCRRSGPRACAAASSTTTASSTTPAADQPGDDGGRAGRHAPQLRAGHRVDEGCRRIRGRRRRAGSGDRAGVHACARGS